MIKCLILQNGLILIAKIEEIDAEDILTIVEPKSSIIKSYMEIIA